MGHSRSSSTGGIPLNAGSLARTGTGTPGFSVVIPRTWSQNDWTELWLDPAADVEELAIPGGLDNSLSSIQIGVAGTGETVAACFDSLRIEPGVTGNQAFILQKELLRGLPLKHHWLVGAEVSYYGQHINAFGSQVPVPDYEALGGPLSTADVVEHIHRYGGLACYNHPPVTNLGATAATLIENRAGGADLMEVAHSHRHLQERLLLWDRLGKSGLVITGIAASDAHHAGHGWRPVPAMPASYVNHVWAESLQEKDLLASLKAGRTYVADPMAFRGTLDITGPGDIRMGDVVLAQSEWPALQATLTGVQPGDLAVWLLDGHLVNVSHVQEECHVFQWRAPAAVPGFHVARLQVHRPSLAADPFGGLIAASNPVYVTDTPPETSRRIVRV